MCSPIFSPSRSHNTKPNVQKKIAMATSLVQAAPLTSYVLMAKSFLQLLIVSKGHYLMKNCQFVITKRVSSDLLHIKCLEEKTHLQNILLTPILNRCRMLHYSHSNSSTKQKSNNITNLSNSSNYTQSYISSSNTISICQQRYRR